MTVEPESRSTLEKPSKANVLYRGIPLAVIALAAVLGTLLLGDLLSFETLRKHHGALMALRDSHFALTVLAFVATYVVIVALSIPGATLATITGGFLFGAGLATPINVISATIGAALVFSAARMGAGDYLARRMDASDGRIRRFKSAIDANQWEALFLIRLIPGVPFFLANLLPAMFGVKLHRFVIATALGIIPGALVYTSLGAGLGEVLARDEAPDLGVILTPPILLPILGLAILSALPILIKVMRRKAP